MDTRSRTSLDKLLARAERLASYGTDSDRSTYTLRGVEAPLGKVEKHDTKRSPHCEHDLRAECDAAATEQHQDRVFTGKPIPVANRPSKLETGEIGEQLAIHILQESGFADARRLSVEEAQNFPVDVMADNHVVEVKTGLVSNGESAQHWRATAGKPGVKETAWLKGATQEEKAAWNRVKGKAAIERKQRVLEAISQERGIRLSAKTYGIILNPDTRQADIFVIDGFHERVGWRSELAKHSYVGTVSF